MSIRYAILTAALVITVAWGTASEAQMYKYRDAQDNVCFTDNLAQIPLDQRPQAQTMKTVKSDDAPGTEAENSKKQLRAGDQVESLGSDETVVDEETIAALNIRKKELDDEFSGLMAEKYALLQEKQKLDGLAGRDVEARQAYEGKVTDLNNRIADYATRRDTFQKECDRVKEALEPTSPEVDVESPNKGPEVPTE